MPKFIYIILLIFSGSVTCYTQSKVTMNCRTHSTDVDITRVLANIKLSKLILISREYSTYVPIQFHLLARSSGGGRISARVVFQGLCKLNEDFEGTGLQFYFNGELEQIDNKALFEMQYPLIT